MEYCKYTSCFLKLERTTVTVTRTFEFTFAYKRDILLLGRVFSQPGVGNLKSIP
jgi:hypothetical protein